MQTMIDIFEQNGIPCRGPGETQFFKSSSVLLAIALLNAIDNPYRDIYLCGAMMSPLFGFTPDELTAIRKSESDAPLYVSILRYVESHPDFSKARCFLDTLSRYRKLSEGNKPQDVLFRLYHETGLLSLAVRNGEDDNLWLLYENARRFENSSYQGLGSFLRYLSRILEKNGTFDAPDSGVPSENAVRFMTVHASKGLEFPVVFLAECGASLTDLDAKKPILFSEKLGFAGILYDETGTVHVDTPMRYAIKHRAKRLMLDEQMRIFYVALTRAAERLFLFGCASKSPEELENKRLNAVDENLRKFSVLSSESFLSWLTLSAKQHVAFYYVDGDEITKAMPEEETESERSQTIHENPADPALVAVLKERFSYEYPDRATLGIPEKLSVSKLYPNVLDGTEEDISTTLDEIPEEPKHREPGFLTGTIEDEAAKRGIATHAFLQFCDFEHLETAGAEAELQRLLEKRFLSEQDASLVRMEEIEAFRRSALENRMRNAKSIHRELRFHVRLPAEKFTLDEKKKKRLDGKKLLVQGVMDCVMEEADGTLTLIDYKTDRLPFYAVEDPKIGENILREKHERQLSYYREAVLSIFGKYPDKTEIYSLLLGRTVSL